MEHRQAQYGADTVSGYLQMFGKSRSNGGREAMASTEPPVAEPNATMPQGPQMPSAWNAEYTQAQEQASVPQNAWQAQVWVCGSKLREVY